MQSFAIAIELRRSRLLDAGLIVLHLLAAAAVILLPGSLWIRGALFFWVGWSLWHGLRPSAVTDIRFEWRRSGRLYCRTDGAGEYEAEILPDSTVFSRLIVLRLRLAGQPGVVALTLLPDQMPAESFRRLKVWLRWRTEAEPNAAASFP